MSQERDSKPDPAHRGAGCGGGGGGDTQTNRSPRKVSARLSDDLFVRLKVHAARQRITTEQAVVDALSRHLGVG